MIGHRGHVNRKPGLAWSTLAARPIGLASTRPPENPIDDVMLDQALNLRDVTRQRGRHYRSAATFACLSLIAAPGCGLGDATSRSEASVEIVRGKDSAGAIVELERRGSRLTNARVIDIVLGRGEGEITQNAKDQVECHRAG